MKNENTPRLETPRLILRRFQPGDEDAILEIYSEKETNTFLPWYPMTTRQEAEKKLAGYLTEYQQPFGCQYAITLRGADHPIGYIHLGEGDSWDFGYAIRRAYWGQGLVTEGAEAVLRWLETTGLPYVTATHDRENPGSGRVMQKLGMRYCYSYREQWQPKDIPVVFRLYQLDLFGPHPDYEKYRTQYPSFVEELG